MRILPVAMALHLITHKRDRAAKGKKKPASYQHDTLPTDNQVRE